MTGWQLINPVPPLPSGVDWDFISKKEGLRLEGYVPKDRTGAYIDQSGVTIGYGFDVGQRTASELRGLALPSYLVARLEPYTGRPGMPLTGKAADDSLTQTPLVVRQTEAEILRAAAGIDIHGKVAVAFNAVSRGRRFEDLPVGAQTAIIDVAYNTGPISRARHQSFGPR
jgi:hypothetical protein